jgi:hypothetical protein
MMRRAILAGVAATVAPLALAAGLTAGHAAPDYRTVCAHGAQGAQCYPAPCPRPAVLASGAYSSYRTAGTMPSGSAVQLSDGDRYACRAGHVIVTSSAGEN